jgi:hypothetical protein
MDDYNVSVQLGRRSVRMMEIAASMQQLPRFE